MKKLFILIFVFLLLVQPTLAYTKSFDENTKTLSIINANLNTIFTIQQIETRSEICNDGLTCKEEDFNITSYLQNDYIFSTDDLKINWQQFKGKNNITRAEFYVLTNTSYEETIYDYGLILKNQTIPNITYYENVTDLWNTKPWDLSIGSEISIQKWNFSFVSANISCNNCTAGLDYYQVITRNPLKVEIFWNETEIIGSHQVTKYRDEWKQIQNLNGKTIKSGKIYIIKVIFYKQAETGNIQLKTIPSFMGVDEDRMTWWNTSWSNSIHNPISDGSRPYQISLNVSNATGTNNASHVFCNGKCNVNFTDIRFTLDNTTALPYWIEDNATGKVWINVTANGSVAMYYGNPTATTTSNGTKTFLFFDDFEDGTLNKWTQSGRGGWIINNTNVWKGSYSVINTNAAGAAMYSLLSSFKSTSSYTIEVMTNLSAGINAYSGIVTRQTTTDETGVQSWGSNYTNTNRIYDYYSGTTIASGGGSSIKSLTWVKIIVKYNGFGGYTYIYDPDGVNVILSGTDVAEPPAANNRSGITVYQDATFTGITSFDNYFVRNYSLPEPVWATWGEQQQELEVITTVEFIDAFII